MADTVGTVMSRNPVSVESSEPVVEAARRMKSNDIGDVVVLDNGRVVGVITDRDITIRVVAEARDPQSTPIRDVASSTDLATVAPDTSLQQARQLMESNAVRRLPVVENDSLVGVVSIGDLAIETDSDSALGQISAAPGNQ